MIPAFGSLGLQRKIMIYVSAGLVALFSLFAYLALGVLHQSSDLIFEERLTKAKTLARDLDEGIRHVVREAEEYAAAASVQHGSSSELIADVLKELSEHVQVDELVRLTGFISFTDSTGKVLLTEPPQLQGEGTTSYNNAVIRKALQTGASVVMANSDLAANHEPGITLVTPVMGEGGTLLGFFRIDFMPELSTLALALLVQESEEEYDLGVITDKGTVVITSGSGELLELTSHMEVISPLVEDRRPGVLEHHPSGEGEQAHVVAYAPLTTVPWGVTLVETSGRALALVNSLERRMIVLGGLGLVLALIVAWFTTRQVVRPLSRLTAGAQQIAAGDLSNPIPTRGADEVRTLAQSFEAMRVKLVDAHEERLRWERELESRVRDRTEEVSQLLQRIVSAQEEERQRLSRDLHDDTAQTLATLLVTLQTIHDTLGTQEKKTKELLSGALLQAGQAMTDIRRIMLDLRPPGLDDLGFIHAVRSYAEDRLASSGTMVEFEVIGGERRMEPYMETALFRILQEAVNNAAKHGHADADKVSICLEFHRDKFVATIEDKGQGFDVDRVLASKPDNRQGLKGMRERAALIGATLSFRSQHGVGTTIQVEVPLA